MVLDKLKKGMDAIVRGAKILGTEVQASIAYKLKADELKRVLLSRFKARQLDEIGVREGISLKRYRSKQEKVRALAERLSLKKVVEYARRYKVKYKDVVEELDRFKAQLESKKQLARISEGIENIVNTLKEFRPEPVRGEEDLEKQLYQYLRARLTRVPVRRQVRVGRYRIDMQVGPCGVELKVPRSSTQLQRLIGQVRDYLRHFECVAAVILDAGLVRDLASYVGRLREMGVVPIVVEGRLKG
ncbi:hypothetical protein CF15_03165 [Pyrodictium occultum]|uniref:Uncharacterized protein n=1 Tax=Pyrodictium occultum TaxID=2309 RepID=A0A0V8RUX7_PYROC|nr:hypothetical protein [Pyrodictium occultum]KSW11816.1 hypothetical protein CF15_03165 [Pyrodictium occultum]